jgi:hypothetical protein
VEGYVTVTDAAGRVLFRRPATAAEVGQALAAAADAERGAHAALERIARERGLLPAEREATIAGRPDFVDG